MLPLGFLQGFLLLHSVQRITVCIHGGDEQVRRENFRILNYNFI